MNIKKSSLILILYLILFNLSAEETAKEPFKMKKGYLSFNYGYKVNTTQQFSIGISPFITNRLAFDVPITGWSYIANDPYNDTKDNYSVYQFLAPAALTITNGGICKLLGMDDPGYTMFFLPAILNSTLNYNIELFSGSDLQNEFYVAPFIKNETDWFVMRKHDWVQVSPGIGLRWQFGAGVGIVLSTGYQKSFQNDFQSKPTFKDMYFFGISLIGDPSQ